jgi:hypothetical protein
MLRPFSLLRRSTGIAIAILLVMLVAASVAQANFDTIRATAGMPFSGVVDSGPSCDPPVTATIHWGDGASSAGTFDASSDTISGTHTYGAAGTFTGTIDLTGSSTNGCPSQDTFTANVAPAPMFTECPPVGADSGCQFLITVSNNGNVVQQDPNQGPYENAEDALIGVVNNSSAPISHMPLSVPGSDLFNFEGDGLCNPSGAGPAAPGCVDPGGGTCGAGGTSAICSFPRPAGQPANYTEPGAPTGNTQNGYEGPTTWFSNLKADTSGGQVNFSPALQPGQSTYFSLEEPPTSTTIGVGSSPSGVVSSPPKVGTSTASFAGTVNPEGLSTTAFFQYGLDLRYIKLHASGPNYDHQTPARLVGSDFNDHLFASQVSGLVPNAIYHVRLVAQNPDGTTFGPDVVFKTDKDGNPGPPTVGKTFNVSATGLVLIKLHGVFVPLTELRQIPNGTIINALHGTLTLITAGGTQHATLSTDAKHKKKSKKVKTQTGKFGGAVFKVTQARSGLATITLVSNAFKGAPSFASCKTKKGKAVSAAVSSKTLQLLHSSAHGKFRTKGRYAAATVRGTIWTIADRCDGTLTHAIKDTVTVSDFVRHKTITLRAGHSYLALAKPKKHK